MRHFALAAVVLFLVGVMQIVFQNGCNTIVQVTVPDELRGRVMGVYMMVFAGATPLGASLIGSIAEGAGVPAACLVGGGLGAHRRPPPAGPLAASEARLRVSATAPLDERSRDGETPRRRRRKHGMTDYRSIESRSSAIRSTCAGGRSPSRSATARPRASTKFTGTEPSGCSFWRVAAGGRTFYTVPSDHYNCAVGSHTHDIALPPDRAEELDQTLGFMTGIGYLRMEEVPGHPAPPEDAGRGDLRAARRHAGGSRRGARRRPARAR